jgi:hypothetical protein
MRDPSSHPERDPPVPPEDAPARQKRRTPEGRAQSEKVQRQLDEALAASFPASDPVSIVTSHEEEDWGQPENK